MQNLFARWIEKACKAVGNLVKQEVEVSKLGGSLLVVNWHRLFVWSAALLLTVTAIGKLGATLGYAEVLAVKDAVIGFLTFRQVLLIAGLSELGVAMYCLMARSRRRATTMIAGLATCFLLYRLTAWATGIDGPCGCLGSMSDAIGLSEETAETWVNGILGYLLVGSYWGLVKRYGIDPE